MCGVCGVWSVWSYGCVWSVVWDVCGVCRWMCVECECEESGECVWNVMVVCKVCGVSGYGV